MTYKTSNSRMQGLLPGEHLDIWPELSLLGNPMGDALRWLRPSSVLCLVLDSFTEVQDLHFHLLTKEQAQQINKELWL